MGSDLGRQMTVVIALLLLMGASTLPVEACGWWCGSKASSYGRASRSYGYQASLARRPAARPLSRAQGLSTPPIPGGRTTLDPPGLMTTQGILESPIPTTGPTLLGSPSPQYAYSGMALPVPRSRRWRR